MTAKAMCLRQARAVPLGVAEGADGLHITMMICVVTQVMVVLMPALARPVLVPAVAAWQCVRMRTPTCADLHIDTLAGLNFVSVARRHWLRARARWAHCVVGPLDLGVLSHCRLL